MYTKSTVFEYEHCKQKFKNIWHKTSSKFTMFDFKTFMASKLLRNILLHRYCILQHGNAFLIGIFIAFGIDKVELIR